MNIVCVVPSRSTLGEGAWWDARDLRLWWVDITEGLIHCFDPVSGKNESVAFGEPVGCVAVREQGGLVVAAKSGFWSFDPVSGRKARLCDPEPHLPGNRFNDGVTDTEGRFWAGTIEEGDDPGQKGRFYRLDPDGTVTAWFGKKVITNGLAFSPDGSRLYFADTAAEIQSVWVCDYDPVTGMPGTPTLFFDMHGLAGRPDGATVDAEGCYWVAAFEGGCLYRITPTGSLLQSIELPVSKPTRPMFGGKDLDVLFVTSSSEDTGPDEANAGGLFAIYDLGIKGIAQTRFRG